MQFQITRDIQGVPDFGLYFNETNNYQFTLQNGVEATLTVPSDTNYKVVFSYEPGSKVWVAPDATATAPNGTPTATACQLNPPLRYVKAGTVLHFITNDTTAQVGVALYAQSA